MTFKSFLLNELAEIDLVRLEKYLDRIFAALNTDVEFTRHFKERLFGREKRLSGNEIAASFKKLLNKYREKIIENTKVVSLLKDLSNDINIPFQVRQNRDGSFDLITITIMKKKGFKTKDQDRVLPV